MSALLRLDRVTKRFGGLVAVKNVGFEVQSGEVLGLLGPNGSGKTTVLNMVSGALPVTGGTIHVERKNITGMAPDRIARTGVARTFQLVRALPSLSVSENVLVSVACGPPGLWGAAAEVEVHAALDRVGLGGMGSARVDSLTYIDQKRLELARAIAAKPRLLLLDEWLAGLNPSELRIGIDLIGSLRDTGITIVMVEHIMDAVRALCPRVMVMNSGTKIADGNTEEVLKDPDVIRAYLGEDHA